MGICQVVSFLSSSETLSQIIRTTEWTSRHGTITFDRKLMDQANGIYEVIFVNALLEAKVGDTIDVFCSNTDIEFRTDYNSAKFSGWLVKQK